MIIEQNADILFSRDIDTFRSRSKAHDSDRAGKTLLVVLMTIPLAMILTGTALYHFDLSLLWALPLYSVTGSVVFLSLVFAGLLASRLQG